MISRTPTVRLLGTCVLAALIVILPPPGRGHVEADQRSILDDVRFEQHLGADLTADATFVDERGRSHRIAELTGERPTVLVLAWFDCPNLCSMVLDQVARATAVLPFDPNDYRVLVASIAPAEGPADARGARERLQRRHDHDFGNWHFLTGERESIDRLAGDIGFHYVYDAARERYAHPAGMVIATPDARVSHYLLGLEPTSNDLRLALVEAADGDLGGLSEQVLLRCYRFDPSSGQYNVAVLSLVRWVGGSFVLAVGGIVFWLWRRERT